MAATHSRRAVVLFLFQLAVLFETSGAGRVESIEFKTTSSPPALAVPPEAKPFEGMVRVGLQTLSESALVTGALTLQASALGLTEEQATNLNAILSPAYASMAADPSFAKLPSALPYCYATEKETNGHYFLYRPEKIGPEPLIIVFLHGYGGNFQFYL